MRARLHLNRIFLMVQEDAHVNTFQQKRMWLLVELKAAVTRYGINALIATVKKTSLFVSLNRSHCTEILSELQSQCFQNGSDHFSCKIKVIAMKLAKFLI